MTLVWTGVPRTLTMVHYCTREADGTIHVTNMVGPHTGQHHVHTAEDFENWQSKVRHNTMNEIKWITTSEKCDCGKSPKPPVDIAERTK